MAYYYPTTYQPYGGYYPVMQQPPVQQPPAPQSNLPTAQNGIIWINGIQEAQMYPIAPNNAVALWEKSGKTIYLKHADATGKPSMTIYDLVERTETGTDGTPGEDGKVHAYATKDELVAVAGIVRGFDDIISGLKADVDAIKGDMYGIAGKRKPRKTAEVAEDDA